MQATKCVLDLNRNDLADSLDFDMNLKTNPTDMIEISYQNWLDFSKTELDLETILANKRLIGWN